MLGFLKVWRKERYQQGWQWYRYRGLVFLPVLLFLLVVHYNEFENDYITWPVGMFLFGIGVGIRIWAQMHLHYRLKERKVLTITGPYAFARNPIYVGNSLILIGLCVVSELHWFLPIMTVMCLMMFSRVVRYEESHLREKYGEPYEAYLASVPRWWPKRWKVSEAVRLFPKEFFGRSLLAESYNLLYLAPFIAKELILH